VRRRRSSAEHLHERRFEEALDRTPGEAECDCSDGSDHPARVKIRTPTLPALATLPDQMRDVNVADIAVVLSGVDLCIACADR